jgi:large subunit ribosomal protein L22
MARESVPVMRVVATAKDVRITSRKARVVANSVIGLPVAEALTLLSFTPRHAAREVAKVIRSAAANAENNYNLSASSLRVAHIEIEQAGIMKRYIPKPRGMAGSLFKRTSHLRCYVTDEEPEKVRRSLVAMPGRSATSGSTRSAATRRRRPAQVRRAVEAAEAAAAAEAEATVPAVDAEDAEPADAAVTDIPGDEEELAPADEPEAGVVDGGGADETELAAGPEPGDNPDDEER